MRTKNNLPVDFSNLRKLAEEKIKLKKKKEKAEKSSILEHELHVREIELEMQNDELQKTQLNLLKSITDYTHLFEYAPVGYFILDKEGIIKNVNRKASSKQLQLTKKQLIGKPFSIFLVSETTQDDFYRHRIFLDETGIIQKMEAEFKRTDKPNLPILICSTKILDDNKKFKHYLCMTIDIPERKIYEQKMEDSLAKEVELNALKSKFISMASHEFKTPLASILSSVWLIDNYNKLEDKEKRKKHINRIKSSVNELTEILNEFLSIHHIESNLIKNAPSSFNIIRFIQNIIIDFNENKSRIIFNHKLTKQVVYIDPKLLKICLSNLLSNAIKYSAHDKNILINILENETGKIIITIKDNGIGISETDQEHIFEQFFRAKNADTIQGTGLGLNITKSLINLMDGAISFTSELNNGTEFCIQLPKNEVIV